MRPRDHIRMLALQSFAGTRQAYKDPKLGVHTRGLGFKPYINLLALCREWGRHFLLPLNRQVVNQILLSQLPRCGRSRRDPAKSQKDQLLPGPATASGLLGGSGGFSK